MTIKENSESTLDIDASIFDQGGICVRGARAKRFMDALYEVISAVESLQASVPLFVNTALGLHEIDHRYAVESFSKYVDRRLSLLLSAAVNEDHIDFPVEDLDQELQS